MNRQIGKEKCSETEHCKQQNEKKNVLLGENLEPPGSTKSGSKRQSIILS